MQDVLIEDHADGVTVITINRPGRRNAIASRTACELQAAFQAFNESRQRVAVLTGSGSTAFSAGADISDIPEFWRCIPGIGIQTEKPIISAVAGWCIGGGMTMAVMADLIVASEDAKFYYPEAKLGLTQGAIAGLAARIPHKAAMEIMLLARVIDARRAREIGLINEVSDNGNHLEDAMTMARELAGMAPMVLATLKRFVNNSILPKTPTEQLALAKMQLDAVANSADCAEGFAAAKEKRVAIYQGS